MEKAEKVNQTYACALHLLIGMERAIRSANMLLELTEPEDTMSEVYLDAASHTQSYFINTEAVRQTMQSGSLQYQINDSTQSAIIFIGKAIRNHVAHEGLWLPSYFCEVRAGIGSTRYFGISSTRLLKSLKNTSEKATEKSTEREELTNNNDAKIKAAETYIQNNEVTGVIILKHFVNAHLTAFFPPIIKRIQKFSNTPLAKKITNNRQVISLGTLSDLIARIKSYKCYPA